MQPLSAFYPFVQPEVMGCPLPVIDHHLRLAAREFCERAKAWWEWQDAVTLDGTTNRFDYDLASGAEIVQVLRAIINDEDIAVVDGASTPSDWNDLPPHDVRQPMITHFDTQQYMLFPFPSAGDVLNLQVAYRPTLAATQLGDILYSRYAEKLADGCKARLMAMVQQEWANEKLAAYYAGRFERAVTDAANDDFQRGKESRRSKPNPNGGSRWPYPRRPF